MVQMLIQQRTGKRAIGSELNEFDEDLSISFHMPVSQDDFLQMNEDKR